jgi:hypothetical protein
MRRRQAGDRSDDHAEREHSTNKDPSHHLKSSMQDMNTVWHLPGGSA